MSILKTAFQTTSLNSDKLQIELLKTGDIFKITSGHNQINLLSGNLIDGQFSNIYLRRKDLDGYQYEKLIGVFSKGGFCLKDNKAYYQGIALGVSYQVVLSLEDNLWHYDVTLSKHEGTYDLIYAQDLGIASKGSIQSSEAYTAQYIDHKAFKDELGYTICSRQNQGDPQFLQIGSLNKTVAYQTDGFQFFGLSYKETGIPEVLLEETLKNVNYQYEFPYIALQTESFELKKEETFSFYGLYLSLHEDVTTKKEKVKPYEVIKAFVSFNELYDEKNRIDSTNVLQTKEVNQAYFEGINLRHVEEKDGKLLSFFKDDHVHVVLKEKERLVERPHGHLILHGDLLHASENVMATTNFIYGVFNSHVVLGNTNFHKLTGDVRSFLNVTKISGMRIYVKIDGRYVLLAMPSFYEIGINYAKWVYVIEDDELTVCVYSNKDALVEKTTLESKNHKTYDVIVSNQLTMNTNEYETNISYTLNKDTLIVDAKENQMIMAHYPGLKYQFNTFGSTIKMGRDVFGFDEDQSLICFTYEGVSNLQINLEATFNDTFTNQDIDFDKSFKEAVSFIDSLTGIQVENKAMHQFIDKLSDTVFWYTNNALTHYASPHGLEQYNGAAWGTRDVCQGPVELFMSAQRFDLVREILLKVFSRQFIEDGDFPQWFMFDKYFRIQAHESHGDIIMWPIRTLAHYLKMTKDTSILMEQVAYMSKSKNEFTKETVSLLDHVKFTLESIKKSFIPNTNLPRYGGGDWDDTLQPANQKLTDKMVSGWTVALFYDALAILEEEVKSVDDRFSYELKQLKEAVSTDYNKYLVKDNVPAGFVVFEDDHLEYLLHPSDLNTGLNYRLLALKRPIISQMITKEQANKYHDLIKTHLKHPDGVRLMNTAVTYQGGKKTYFQRAETAANFGREIGIQYVHAHLRYIEAMTILGKEKDAFDALFEVNPINIKDSVKNASYRQSNVYFSSSDAKFNDRYEAKKNFHLVKEGKIEVKQGWRLYSSGPGIYINQVIRNILGIKVLANKLYLDPMLKEAFDQTEVTYHYQGKKLHIRYLKSESVSLEINGKKMPMIKQQNQYRNAGFLIDDAFINQQETINITYYF